MNVDAIRKHLSDLADFMAAAGASDAVVKEVRAVAGGLSPFKDYKLPAFAAFLQKAEVYDRTKELPVVGKPVKPKPATPAAAPAAAEVRGRVVELYERAAAATDEQIETVMAVLNASTIKAPDLVGVAAALGIEGRVTGRTAKKKIVDEIRRAIRDRRGIADRTLL